MQTDLNYPSELPAPLKMENAFQPVSPLLRTSMTSGRAFQRQQFEMVPTMNQFAWVMDDGQAAAFQSWYKQEINNGASWFNIKRATPLGYISLVCRFTDIYQGPVRYGRDRWRFTATLEIFEIPTLPSDWWDILPDYVLNPEIFDLAMNREWPEATP